MTGKLYTNAARRAVDRQEPRFAQPFDTSPGRIRALQELVLATDTLQGFLGHVAGQVTSIGPDLSCGITVSTDSRRP